MINGAGLEEYHRCCKCGLWLVSHGQTEIVNQARHMRFITTHLNIYGTTVTLRLRTVINCHSEIPGLQAAGCQAELVK